LAGILQETFSLIGVEQRIGSPAFLAPELWRGQVATPQSDIYALGILAYQLFAGKLPFEASTIGAVEYQHLNEIPLPPSKHQPDLSKDVDAVFERVLAKQSAHRFPTASLFIQALAIALDSVLDVETSVQPALKVDAPLSRPLLSSETLIDDAESIDQTDEALVTDIDIPAPHSPILKWIRRVGCLAMIVVWMALMLSPCLLLTVIVRGEATLPLSDKPGHQLRMFKIFEDDVRGFGFSWGSVEQSNNEGEMCIKSHVRYFTWQGSGENVDFCQCYTKVDDDWVAGTSVDNMCNPSQN
jgi:serine/threonine protein kinase